MQQKHYDETSNILDFRDILYSRRDLTIENDEIAVAKIIYNTPLHLTAIYNADNARCHVCSGRVAFVHERDKRLGLYSNHNTYRQELSCRWRRSSRTAWWPTRCRTRHSLRTTPYSRAPSSMTVLTYLFNYLLTYLTAVRRPVRRTAAV